MKTSLLILIHKFLSPLFLKVFCGFKAYNRRAFHRTNQFLLVANHNSHLDTLVLLSTIPFLRLREVHVVAAGDYFGKNFVQKWLMKCCFNAVLINRKNPKTVPGQQPLALMADLLEQGKSLIVFPEGTRGKAGVMEPFKSGVGRLLQAYPHIPYIPAFLRGAEACWPKGAILPTPNKIRLYLGLPSFPTCANLGHIIHEMEQQVSSLGKIAD